MSKSHYLKERALKDEILELRARNQDLRLQLDGLEGEFEEYAAVYNGEETRRLEGDVNEARYIARHLHRAARALVAGINASSRIVPDVPELPESWE